MKSLATRLAEAIEDPRPDPADNEEPEAPEDDAGKRPTEEGGRVRLAVGQHVIVRTDYGEKVTEGDIEEVFLKAQAIRIRDRSSGTDIHMDIDPAIYEVWVQDPDIPGDAPYPASRTLYLRPSRPGIYTGGRY